MFRWVPGEGYDEAACSRLAAAFPKPHDPMGEAWFMGGERRMFVNLTGDLNSVPVEDLIEACREIISGMRCFGPAPDWIEWFHYMLGRLIPRAHEYHLSYLLESLIGGFITQYQDGITAEPYRGFRDDVLNSLGRCMMDANYWSDGRIVVGEILHQGVWPSGRWGWFDASGDFSASMFFCLKYLRAEEIGPWLKSVFSIACPHWRAQVIAWFVGAHKVLVGDWQQPEEFSGPKGKGGPAIGWEDSHCLNGDYSDSPTKHVIKVDPGHFLPATNRARALDTVRTEMSQDVLVEWLISMEEFAYLETELLYLPGEFAALYLGKR